MKTILLSVVFSLINYIAIGGIYDTVILPVTADKLQDEIIRKDISSIVSQDIGIYLDEYKTKHNNYLVIDSYKGSSWNFYTTFSQKINSKKKLLEMYCLPEKAIVNDIRFFHVKYMLRFSSHSLSVINKEILSVLGAQNINCIVKSYISKDRLRNYLRLTFFSDTHKKDFIFIIKNSEFYNCVQIN